MKIKNIGITIVLLVVTLLLCSCHKMTQQEILAQEKAEEAYIASRTAYYEVMSVKQYVTARTNNYGGIQEHNICYCITYLDNDGVLRTNEDFRDLPNCKSYLMIGEKDLYVVEEYGACYLYLTKETLKTFTGT